MRGRRWLVVRPMRRIVLVLPVIAAGCGWFSASSTPQPGRTPARAAACLPASWACGDVVKLDAHSGVLIWQVETNGDVNSVVADGHGGVFIAGGFTRVAGVRRRYVAHILPSGRLDAHWQPRVWSRAPVRFTQPTLALRRGRLFAAGLTTSSERPAGIAAINANTGVVDPRWGVGLRVVGGVAALAVAGHRVYVGGTLVRRQTVIASVAALDLSTGALDQAFRTPVLSGGEGTGVNALAAAGGRLYVGGQYASVNNVPLNGLSVVDQKSGRLVGSWRPQLSRCGVCVQASLVYSVAVGQPGIYVAAAALRVDGKRREGLALMNPTTGAVQPWAPRVGGNAEVVTVGGGRVYIGGDFTRVDDRPRRGLAALDPRNGRVRPSWQPSVGTSAVLSLSAGGGSTFAGTVEPGPGR